MIKLFCNIRKNLLSEGKTTNYLKYTIGEIILVVIGGETCYRLYKNEKE
jgi:hypothetical protein